MTSTQDPHPTPEQIRPRAQTSPIPATPAPRSRLVGYTILTVAFGFLVGTATALLLFANGLAPAAWYGGAR